MAASEKEPVRILIIDDHAIVRAGLRMLIEAHTGMRVIGEAGNRNQAFEVAAREPADIILLDLDIDGENSLDFMRDLKEKNPHAQIIILTGVRDPELHRRAVRQGAMGLVLKEKAAEALIKAIEKVNAGEVWLDRSLTASVLTQMTSPEEAQKSDPDKARIAMLTHREREIITLVCEGLKNKQIAERLYISEATVRNHLTSILSKLELSDRFELALFSYRHGLAKPPI
ncbi:MAG TPA: response regulator transcription factor [Blastocatellia bacterium]|nr:response regulator transcription factor [Blastocatellia bacterium]